MFLFQVSLLMTTWSKGMVDLKLKKHIIPAMIAKSQEEFSHNIEKVIDVVDWVQLDIMDNVFVPNTSLFFEFTLPDKQCSYEAHLMVQHPMKWIEEHLSQVDTVLVHVESTYDVDKIISRVKEAEKKIGFVLNPQTPVSVLSECLDEIDQVLIMTVKPGFYGSKFLPEMADKITQLREMKPDLDIEVDGGITPDTIGLVAEAGANLFVSGSYIVKADQPAQSIKTLKQLIDEW